MLEPIEGFPEDVVAVRGVGLVTADDYRDVLAPAIARATAGGRRARLLIELGAGFEGYDTGGLFADAGLGAANLRSFARIAVVTDAGGIRRSVQLFGGFIPAEVRVFATAASAAARQWIVA